MPYPFHSDCAAAILRRLQSDPETGLSTREAQRRRARIGPNRLEAKGRRPLFALLARQISDPLILLLIVATGLALYLGDVRGAAVLGAIIAVNAVVGAYQENKAERVLARLKVMLTSRATVLRDSTPAELAESDLVPGDIVLLEEGGAVPADIRLIESRGLATNDFILTGESDPQSKDADARPPPDAPLHDRDTMVYFGTTIARGRAKGVVVATGTATEIGTIAKTSEAIAKDLSPLQREIAVLARWLAILAFASAAMLFAALLAIRWQPGANPTALINTSLLLALGVAAACVPQGLPAQISVALSLGVGRMARRNAVVKRLSAIETLGSATVICTDKTGTLTRNEMTVAAGWVWDRDIDVTGLGYAPDGSVRIDGREAAADDLVALNPFFTAGILAGHSAVHAPDAAHPLWYALGDPTEAAFAPLAVKAGLDPDALDADAPRLAEFGFDSRRRRMTVVRDMKKDGVVAYMKGAPKSVLGCCSRILKDGRPEPLGDADRDYVLERVSALSRQALRVIALAMRPLDRPAHAWRQEETEREFTLIGLAAMLDPPREDAADAVAMIRQAGVRLFILTGDDPETAQAIARRIGLPPGPALTGTAFRALPDEEVATLLRGDCVILSRVSPNDKNRIVRALKADGQVVAMTGDGVNDTLSLKRADIGIAMGRMGSDVAKEAADVILLDDDFATLVRAIREGRTIYRNLSNTVLASMTSNLGELTCVVAGLATLTAGQPMPLTAVQVLAIDLIGEMAPLTAMTFDRGDDRVMQRGPRATDAHILNRARFIEIAILGLAMGCAGYAAFAVSLMSGTSDGSAQAAAYTTVVLTQYINVLARRTAGPLLSRQALNNRWLLGAIVTSFLIVLAIVSVPSLGIWFGFEPLAGSQWVIVLVAVIAFAALCEGKRLSMAWFKRR